MDRQVVTARPSLGPALVEHAALKAPSACTISASVCMKSALEITEPTGMSAAALSPVTVTLASDSQGLAVSVRSAWGCPRHPEL
jgi:hypothetical protein